MKNKSKSKSNQNRSEMCSEFGSRMNCKNSNDSQKCKANTKNRCKNK
jgi:hypothetical protein